MANKNTRRFLTSLAIRKMKVRATKRYHFTFTRLARIKVNHTDKIIRTSLVAQKVKHLPTMQGSIPGTGRSHGEGNDNPLQYSCLENPMDGGAWWAPVHGVPKSQTQLRDFIFTS